MTKTLDQTQHHFIIEINSDQAIGKMKCNHSIDDEDFTTESRYNGKVCIFNESYDSNDILGFYDGVELILLDAKIKEVNGNPMSIHDLTKNNPDTLSFVFTEDSAHRIICVDGEYVEDSNGSEKLTIEAGHGKYLQLFYNGEKVDEINVKLRKRTIAFPVEVTSIDVDYADDFGLVEELTWEIVGDGVEV